MSPPRLDELLRPLDRLGDRGAACVNIGVGGRSHLPANEFVNGQTGALAGDVPQSHVEAGLCVVRHGPVSPVAGYAREPGQVFDVSRIPPDHQPSEVILHVGNHRTPALGKGCAAEAVESCHVRVDADDHQGSALRRGDDRSHARDSRSVAGRPRLVEGGLVCVTH